jgi:uncharacterized protein DUF6445
MIEFNDAATVHVKHIGQRGIAVTRIENVLTRAEEVAAFARAQSFAEDRSNFYPGMRAPVPEDFSTAFRPWLGRLLQREFRTATSCFSVVTTARTDLLPIQRIPHYDSTDPGLIAVVIYLCDSRYSGTSFYRHRRTGFEEITDENRRNYQLALDNDLRLLGPPRREYFNGDDAVFERIFASELKFNSAIVYPGRVLHAANIPRGFEPPKTRDDWRLTVTSLLQSA